MGIGWSLLSYLGAPAPMEAIQERAPTSASTDSSTPKFKAGDCVKVQLEVEIFRQMQEGHGGWNDQMAEVSSAGSVCGVSCHRKLHM